MGQQKREPCWQTCIADYADVPRDIMLPCATVRILTSVQAEKIVVLVQEIVWQLCFHSTHQGDARPGR